MGFLRGLDASWNLQLSLMRRRIATSDLCASAASDDRSCDAGAQEPEHAVECEDSGHRGRAKYLAQ